jgi:hypothetical protein
MLFLRQFVKDTQEYLQHSKQPDKQTMLQGQLDAITLITRKFQQLFTLPIEEPGLFDEREEKEEANDKNLNGS